MSRYWELILSNGDGLVDTKEAHRREKNRIFLYDLLSPLVFMAESKESPNDLGL